MSGVPPLPHTHQNAVVALGNFDGVHRGHGAVINAAVHIAKESGAPTQVLTFEPHPRAFFQPNLPPFRLTPAAQKERLLHARGIHEVIAQPFTAAFAQLTAEEFIEKILIETLRVKHVVAGFDFVFGHGRGGHINVLREKLLPRGIGVTEIVALTDKGGAVFSSSRTRQALQTGDTQTAAHILGRPWAIAGMIQHGAQRGRTIDVPTANMPLGEYLRPKFGVYAIKAHRVSDRAFFNGVANIGTRPTVDGQTETLECHLFDFDAAIYGQEWEVELHNFIRPEQSFSDFDSLRLQIVKDVEIAKGFFTQDATSE